MKRKPIPSLEDMYAALDAQIALAKRLGNTERMDWLLDQRLSVPDLREFLTAMGARGADA